MANGNGYQMASAHVPGPFDGTSWNGTRRLYLAIGGCAVVVHLGALWNEFAMDDRPIIVLNRLVHGRSGLWRAFAHPYWPADLGGALYRPLTIATYVVDWVVGEAAWFHVVNLGWHAAASVAVAALARRWSGTRADSLYGGGPHLKAAYAFFLVEVGDTTRAAPLAAAARAMLPRPLSALRVQFLLALERGERARAFALADTAGRGFRRKAPGIDSGCNELHGSCVGRRGLAKTRTFRAVAALCLSRS